MFWWRHRKTSGKGFWLIGSETTIWFWLSIILIAMIATTIGINVIAFIEVE